MNQMQYVAYMIERAEGEWEDLRAETERAMDHLRNNLFKAASQLSAAANVPQRYAVNRLGVVQGAGAEVDRLCALLEAKVDEVMRLRETLHALNEIVAQQ